MEDVYRHETFTYKGRTISVEIRRSRGDIIVSAEAQSHDAYVFQAERELRLDLVADPLQDAEDGKEQVESVVEDIVEEAKEAVRKDIVVRNASRHIDIS